MRITTREEGIRLNLLIIMYFLEYPDVHEDEMCAHFTDNGLLEVRDQNGSWNISWPALIQRARRLRDNGLLKQSGHCYRVSLHGEAWYAQICRSRKRGKILGGYTLHKKRPRGRPPKKGHGMKDYLRWGQRKGKE